MIIACLPSNTTYDVQCPVCGRGFLFLTDPTEAAGADTLRRSASVALAAQHNQLKARSDRRRGPDRRSNQMDCRAQQVERRRASNDRRARPGDRRSRGAGSISTDLERRTAAPTFRRGSGAAHPQCVFYLQGWDGDQDSGTGLWPDGMLLQREGTSC